MEDKEQKQSTMDNAILTFSLDKLTDPTPKFAESKAAWIPYGADNNYPHFLLELSNHSSKHNSLVKKKVNMTAGEGFVKTAANSEFIANVNGKEDCDEIAFKLAYDLNIYGGYCYAVTWSNDGRSIARKTYVDYSKVRMAKVVEDEDDEMSRLQAKGVDYYYISSDWMQHRKEKHKPELIQGFDPNYTKEKTQLVYMTEYRAGVDFYTYPDYISALNYIHLDYEISNFHLSSVHNSFTPSMIISHKGGIPSEEKQREYKKKLKKQYGGSDNGSQVFVTFSKNGETAPEFIPLNLNASDERFLQLEQAIQQNIIIAHGASPIVAGVATSGKLGSSDEVIESEQVFQKNVIDSKQKMIERSFNKLLKINGIQEEIKLKGIKSFDEAEKEDDKVEEIDVESQAKANLRGSVGGVTGILDIAAQVTSGTISRQAGISILEIIFGLSKDDAIELLGGVEEDETIKTN
mgnify:CR=1 FL=1